MPNRDPEKERSRRIARQAEYRQRERDWIANPPPRPPRHEPPNLVWADMTAFVLGDPPIGRRAIDQRGA